MTPRDLAMALVWAGALLLAGLLLYRFRRGAWSLEDEDIPPPSPAQKLCALAGMLTALAGIVLFIWSYVGDGVG
jgi:hypothetical protein